METANGLEHMLTSRSTNSTTSDSNVEIWSATLDSEGATGEKTLALLSPDERDRARRFRFPIHRTQYIARRGILRILLGHYLSVSPASIRFAYGSHGKPFLAGEQLQFNLSQSGNQACFAFSSKSPVGIDLERIRPISDVLTIAGEFCSEEELAILKGLPPEEQTPAFFHCWTKKEALVKALGQGLSYPLNHVSVFFRDSIQLIDKQQAQMPMVRWHFHSWETKPGYVGAVASLQPNNRIVSHVFGW